MEEPPPNKTCILKIFLCAIAFLFFACAEEKVNIVSSYANLVLDFPETGKPNHYLSLFAEFSSNVRRLEYISVWHDAYNWKIETPLLFQAENKSWAGYMNLAAPPNLKKIPKGRYVFDCIDAAGNKAQGSFYVEYDDSLLDEEFSMENFLSSSWRKRVAVYSEAAELLYFDIPNEKWMKDENVFSSVKNSNSLRHIFKKGEIICLAPKIYKDGGSSNGL